MSGGKCSVFVKVEGLIIQKLGNISIRYLLYSRKLHGSLIAVRSLVCQSKIREVFSPKPLLINTKLVPVNTSNEAQFVAIDQIANQNQVPNLAETTRWFSRNLDMLGEGMLAALFRSKFSLLYGSQSEKLETKKATRRLLH